MRVTRWHRWGKRTNNQETRGVVSRQWQCLTWEHMAHRSYEKSYVLTQNKNTSTWPAKQNHSPCAKRDMNMQLIRRLINHVFTQNMTKVKTHSLCFSLEHSSTQNKTKQDKAKRRQRIHTDREVHGPSEPETPRSHSKTKPGAWVSEPQHETNWAWNKTRVSGSENHAP